MTNPLLSEFDGVPIIGKAARNKHGGIFLALASAFWAMLAIVLARLAYAHCVYQVFGPIGSPIIQPDEVPIGNQNVTQVYFGYWVELNHAPFHLIGVTLFCLFCSWFVVQAGSAFTELCHGKKPALVLLQTSSSNTAIEYIAAINKRFFRVWLPFVVGCSIFLVYHTESKTWDNRHVGWVQAALFGDDWKILWKNRPLRQQPQLEVPKTLLGPNRPSVVLLDSWRGKDDSPKGRHYAIPFLLLAFGHQVAFYSLCGWMTGKICFVLFVMLRALTKGSRNDLRGLCLFLRFDDESKRFGLKAFDQVYDSALLIVFVAAIGVMLQLNNTYKESASSEQSQDLMARLLECSLPALVVAAITLCPLIIFRIVVLDPQRKAILAANDAQDYKKSELARQQNTWPYDDKFFKGILVCILTVMVFLPLGMSKLGPSWLVNPTSLMIEKLPKFIYFLG